MSTGGLPASGKQPGSRSMVMRPGEPAVASYSSRTEWLAARRAGIGSSEAAAVLGVSAWSSPYKLWTLKTGLVEEEYEDSEVKRFGRVVEPLIAEDYERLTGRRLIDPGQFTIYRHPRYSFMAATHDRLIEAGGALGRQGRGVLSIKTAAFFKDDEWQTEPPLPYQVQIQHEMAVSGCSWGSFALLTWGKPVRWLDVERNDEFIELLEADCAEFWRKVERGEPPAVDGSEHTKEALKRLFPREAPGTVVELGADALAWHAALTAACEEIKVRKKELKDFEKAKAEAENKLRAAIGEAAEAVLPGGVRYACKTVANDGYSVAPFEYRNLRLVKGPRR